MQRLIASLRTHRDKAMALLMLYGGLRSCEVLTLRLRDVDMGGRAARVAGKGGRERVVPLDEDVLRAVHRYVLHERPESVHPELFLVAKGPNRGRPLTAAGLRTIFRYHRRRADVPAGNPHRLRHTFGTNMAQAGVDAHVLKTLMGHSHIDSTQVYVHLYTQLVAAGEGQWNGFAATSPVPYIPVVMDGWDSRPWGETPYWYTRSPAQFAGFVGAAITWADAHPKMRVSAAPSRPLVFVEAWNELGEGSYMLPTVGDGNRYGRALASALGISGGERRPCAVCVRRREAVDRAVARVETGRVLRGACASPALPVATRPGGACGGRTVLWCQQMPILLATPRQLPFVPPLPRATRHRRRPGRGPPAGPWSRPP